MKAKIHPKYYPDAQVICACGNTFITGSTKKLIKIEICHKCHPFFTGEMKYVDALGRVERFQQKQKKGKAQKAVLIARKEKKEEKKKEEERIPRTLREMLMRK